jgi:thiamine biosynthesis protein ThiS
MRRGFRQAPAGTYANQEQRGPVLSISVRINGKDQRLDAPVSVAQLLDMLGFDRRKVAVERNLEIVPRSMHETTALANGDRLEIVGFVGGG